MFPLLFAFILTDMGSTRRIAIIGAGASGLTAIKSCIEESMAAVCYEQSETFGGRWCFKNTKVSDVASVMKSTVAIHSKEMNAFSDFPPPASFPNYLHHSKMLEYLRLYAETFDLLRHIKYRIKVVRVTQSADFHTTGKWIITTKTLTNHSETSEEFDGVMICTGRLSHPFIPSFPNREVFKGKIFHSQEIKHGTAFENLNVVIVGSGNSAVDAAVEISVLASQVYLSTRSGTWILPKVGPRGLPFDMTLLRRQVNIMKKHFGNIVNHYVEKYLEKKFQHYVYQLKPEYRVLDNSFVINDILPDKILTGRVCIKRAINEIRETGVLFEGDDYLNEADVIIFATGYDLKIPVLDDRLYKTTDGQSNLYHGVFPPNLYHPTLAIIGFVETQGPSIPVAENQSRWAARVFNRKSFVDTKNLKESPIIGKDYIEYMDTLAQEYNVKPDFSTLLFKDPLLYWKCMTGPCLSYQYRIVGPHAWESSRTAILEAYERVVAPLSKMHGSNNNRYMNNNYISEMQEC
ncbi:hypothetical protein JTE90_021880 [Oedothorax gibbosus]|uniref:Flavin-containing monooxygenase n=1 Tax=Oedothorax gibbosus TaxID=931172 RepID=A0AAV6V093_9ARAC|nr:hypothetical protein JTE90_021880 [Oedothorax gibbosus]